MMFLKKVLKKYYNITMFQGNKIAKAGLNFCIICTINKILNS